MCSEPIIMSQKILRMMVTYGGFTDLRLACRGSLLSITAPFSPYWRYHLLIGAVNKEITPTTIRIGRASVISPDNAMKIKVNGRNTRVKRIFAIPHAALRLNRKSFPKTQIIKIVKINDNIIFAFLQIWYIDFSDIGSQLLLL